MTDPDEMSRCGECGRRVRSRGLPTLPSMRIPNWVYLFGGVAAGAVLAVVATSIGPGRGAIDGPVAPARTSGVPVVTPTGSSSTVPGASGTVTVDPTTTVPGASTLAQVPVSATEPEPAPTVPTTAPGTAAGPPSTPPGANAALTVPTTTTTTTTTVPTTPVAATAAPTTPAPPVAGS